MKKMTVVLVLLGMIGGWILGWAAAGMGWTGCRIWADGVLIYESAGTLTEDVDLSWEETEAAPGTIRIAFSARTGAVTVDFPRISLDLRGEGE